jgi:hypothetical protein
MCALVLVPLALGLTACGQSDDPVAVLDQAFKTPVNSADASITAEARLRGQSPQLQQPITLRLTGPFRQAAPKQLPSLDWRVSASGAGQSVSGRLVSVPDNAFVEFQGTAYEVGRALVAQVNQNRGPQRSLADFGIDPKTWVVNPQNRGDEKVAGVDTTHISGALDVGRALRDTNRVLQDPQARSAIGGGAAPPGISEPQIAEIEREVRQPTFDVFVGQDDSKIRRVITNVNFSLPPAQQAGAGVQGGTLKLTTELANVDGDQQVRPPANPRPITELLQQFGVSPQALGGSPPPRPPR